VRGIEPRPHAPRAHCARARAWSGDVPARPRLVRPRGACARRTAGDLVGVAPGSLRSPLLRRRLARRRREDRDGGPTRGRCGSGARRLAGLTTHLRDG
jgi:hypothetical protein